MGKFKRELEELSNNEEYKFFLTDEEDAEKLLNTDRYIARKEGHAEGLEEGKKEGILQGAKESKIEIAKSLLTTNMSLEKISKHTKLSIEDLEKIKDTNK